MGYFLIFLIGVTKGGGNFQHAALLPSFWYFPFQFWPQELLTHWGRYAADKPQVISRSDFQIVRSPFSNSDWRNGTTRKIH